MNAEPHDERTLRLVRETVDDTTTYTPDDDGHTAEHLCPPMSVRERRTNPRPTDAWPDIPRTPLDGAKGWTIDYNAAPRIPRQREGINLGKLLAVLGVMVGGAALLVGVVVWYVAIGFRMLP